ncbi:uncharacterized protein LOC127798229 [Diospyros lotus]|uniref:uncharacterized protein LOC127798229 n=1 Tax=Diospyros lotus TaxID=55363 RepID=UPI0022582D14|nr:uncharacterized protein LOC127798229 [Diospyros lotus]
MTDSEELEPLFDYSRVQPVDVCIDDDCSDSSPPFSPKRRKLLNPAVEKEKENKVVPIIDCEEKEKEEDDWLPPPPPPPPKVSNDTWKFIEDSTIKELRLKKQELVSFAKSAQEVLRSVEESVKKDFDTSMQMQPTVDNVTDQSSKVPFDRAKIVISIQDKEGLKQFRVYKDDKFERLFKMYAEKNKLDLQRLIFCFDGDRVIPTASPDGLGMEDDDIIEVHIKSN